MQMYGARSTPYAVCRFVIERPAQLWISQVGGVTENRSLGLCMSYWAVMWLGDSLDVLQVSVGNYGD